MTETDAAVDRSVLVPGAHRVIRAVDGSEGPFTGVLVAYGDGVAVSADAGDLVGWRGWAHSGREHVCGVLDVRRRVDGHDALLPWCTQRVEAFLGRRRAAEVPLGPGELGTLVASLLRGARELGVEGGDAEGEWWLTGDGRPLFVHGAGGGARAVTAALVERLVAHTTDRATTRVLGEVAAAFREHRHHEDDDARWEQELFAIAAPRALRLDVFAPEKAADLASRRSARIEIDADQRVRARRSDRPERDGLVARLRAGAVKLIEHVRGALTRLRPQRSTAPSDRPESIPIRSRRRPLIVAVSLAAVVLAVGLMWPEGREDGPAEAAETVTEAPAVAEPDELAEGDEAQAPSTPNPTPSDAEDAPTALPALIDAIAECVRAAAAQCPAALVDSLSTPSDGLIVQGSAASSATLVDDYGDVAVVRLVPVDAEHDAVEQMVVLERQEAKWLVRDVYDVAHQP